MLTKEQRDVIAQAIQNEVEGYEFYKMASMQAPSEATKKSFMELGNEELKHVEFLKGLAKKLDGSGGDVAVEEFLAAKPPSPQIYTWDKFEKEHLQMAIAVYSIGIQMEKDSIAFYEEAKKKFDDEESKALFDLLIDWERVHMEEFTEQYNIYKGDWWADQQFFPL
ncbi:MAG: ferritin family protein [Tissierellia bacterium]|nr:ferritin family protein [Tissierellia bacterium]